MENILKVLNLKRMLPEAIKDMLQTVELADYNEATEYVIRQARVVQNEKDPKTSTLDLNEDEEGKMKVTFEEPPAQEEAYSTDEWLCWMGKGPGKGNKGSGQKGSKGGFQGNFHYCGVFGHRINECRKKYGRQGQRPGPAAKPRLGKPKCPQRERQRPEGSLDPNQRRLGKGRKRRQWVGGRLERRIQWTQLQL